MAESKFKTPKGKEIEVVKQKRESLYSVQFTSGGQLPKELTGRWTSIPLAEKAIENYLAKADAEKSV